MLEISYKKYWLISIYEKYFGFDNKNYKWYSVVEIHDIAENLNIKWFKKEVHHTWITNLKDDLDQTFKSFSKTTRNEIRRAEKEWIEYIAIDNPNEEELKKYHTFYNDFLKSKNLPTIEYNTLKKFNWYLTITNAKKHWEILCYHTYLRDNDLKKVRLLHSCSHYRLLDTNLTKNEWEFKNLVWYANRWLHFFDMQYFKESLYNEYDWWGIYNWTSDTERIKIARFKQTFSPNEINLYNYKKIPFILNLLLKIKLNIWKIF